MNEKKAYWKAWNQHIPEKGEKDFWMFVKKGLKENFRLYRYFNDAELLYTFNQMIRERNYRNVDLALVKRFIHEFAGISKAPQGILLVDDILEAIQKADRGRALKVVIEKTKPKKKTGKRKNSRATVTPVKLLTMLEGLTWFDEHTKLWFDHLDWIVKGMWESLFEPRNYSKNMRGIRAFEKSRKRKNKIQKAVLKRWNDENRFINKIHKKFSDDFTQKVKTNSGKLKKLTLHQKVVAMYAATKKGFMDLADTGVGKTYTATSLISLADRKKSLIVCPASLIHSKQWETAIKNTFSDAVVYTQKDALQENFSFQRGKRCFYLLSYQTASNLSGKNILRKIKNSIDCVVIDEAQRTKIRDEKMPSRCRVRIENMLVKIRKNRKINVLMLTATPVPNTVVEARSLLEMVSGKNFKEVSNYNRVDNLVAMHVRLKEYSMRYEKVYPVKLREKTIKCSVNLKLGKYKNMLKDVGFLGMDQIALVEAKVPKILKQIKKTPKNQKIILYTKYVTGMVNVLADELERKGISYTYYTGSRKEGLNPKQGALFFNGRRVLIASSAVAEGLDKIQDHCNNIWLVGHPWTYTERQQLVGRIYRTGQKKSVNVITFIAEINGYQYDQNVKIDRINTKKSYHDTIVDGVYPEKLVGRNESWRDIINAIVSGEKVRSSRLVNAGLVRRLSTQHRIVKKRKRKSRKLK